MKTIKEGTNGIEQRPKRAMKLKMMMMMMMIGFVHMI
jgi:hypothetical protein